MNGAFPTTAEKTATGRKRLRVRKSILIAAVIALAALLVGCAVVYALHMQDIKLGEQQVTYDIYDYDPESGEAVAYVGQGTMTQQVLSLAGLQGTPASQAAREWYEFLQSYDPDREIQKSVWGNEPQFGSEYYGYGLYTQEMKDKLDEILTKYDLKLRGEQVKIQTSKLLFQALGVENVLNSNSEAKMRVSHAAYYENGELNLYFDITLPGENGTDFEKTDACLYYRPKDCFIPDTAVLTEGEWEEWNYTTASGDKVLIICSKDAGTAWIYSDMASYTASLRVNVIRRMYEETENGTPAAKFDLMTKEQLEQVADAIDFSLEPKLVDGWENLSDGAVPAGQEINGYRVEPVSAFTDGYGYRIAHQSTGPEGVALTDPNDHTARVDTGGGTRGYCEEDGDGKLNTCSYIISEYTSKYDVPADGSLPYPEGYVVPVYLEDLYFSRYDFEKNESIENLLTEGSWSFDVPLNDADTREIELLKEPITAKACIGWNMDGSDAIEDREITSVELRSLGIDLTSEKEGGDFFSFTGQSSYIVMKDGTQVEFYGGHFDQPIDLDQAAYIQLADGTIIPMPGVDEETVQLISQAKPVEPEKEPVPIFEHGIELLTEPITMKHLAGYVTDPTGYMEPLYEEFTVSSIILHPDGLVIMCPPAFDSPDSEASVILKDGSQIILSGKGGSPYGDVPMNQLTAKSTIDLSKVDYVLLPDGTKLPVPATAR